VSAQDMTSAQRWSCRRAPPDAQRSATLVTGARQCETGRPDGCPVSGVADRPAQRAGRTSGAGVL